MDSASPQSASFVAKVSLLSALGNNPVEKRRLQTTSASFQLFSDKVELLGWVHFPAVAMLLTVYTKT